MTDLGTRTLPERSGIQHYLPPPTHEQHGNSFRLRISISVVCRNLRFGRRTSLADDSWVAPVVINVRGDIFPQFLEDERASGKVQCRKEGMLDRLCHYLWRRSRHELDNTGWHPSLLENLVYQVIGVGRSWRRLPHDNIAYEGGR